ncbi:PLP-dependent aminotransferase family protein [Aquabacterium sp. J223]|uniref:aminotransferase-like domain-containing protein n=1 Tax=Aquabacterium sp. J223 TaxID=2898431 RepID=UPI0021ADB9F5|nr:PLP-dependent aminotransferase family protein [Aquabacterium sp. J223]UUX94738.1 PLP-dependent aminotransferase family protein [Aquabacterium sp. J223]
MFSLDRQSAQPLADQIVQRLRELIGRGQLAPGSRLPSIRRLATQLQVAPNTVVAAYDRLAADGLLLSRGGTGCYVGEGPQPQADSPPLEAADLEDPLWLAQQAHDLRAGVLQASSGSVPAAWLEDGVPLAVLQRAFSRDAAPAAMRCPPQGLPALRERLALLLRGQGIPVDAGRLLTVNGGTQAIDLLCRAFLKPGDAVIAEDPGYFLLFGRLRQAGVRVLPVERRPDGVDLAQFEAACVQHRPKLAFLQPVLHNPTGWGSSPANLHRVLGIAADHGVLIAEDDAYGHLQAGEPVRLSQLAGLQGVIHYASFCKVLSPALRLGYVAAEPPLLKALLREKIYAVLSTPALTELVLLELLSTGRFHKHLERLRQRVARARQVAAKQLTSAGIGLPRMADSGLFLWGAVPPGIAMTALVEQAWQEGIVLASGRHFRADAQTEDRHIRFNVSWSQQQRLVDFLRPRLQAGLAAHP